MVSLIDAARSAGFQITGDLYDERGIVEKLEAFAKIIASSENESCASLVESMGIEGFGTLYIAAAIRTRI